MAQCLLTWERKKNQKHYQKLNSMKILTTIAAAASALLIGYEVIWMTVPDPIETDSYRFEIKTPWSRADKCEFKFKVKNISSDILRYKQHESAIIIDGKEYHETKKKFLLQPGDRNLIPQEYVVRGERDSYLTENFSFKLDGMYTLKTDGPKLDVPNFKLPVAKNSFKVGDFTVSVKDVYKETKETKVKFDVLYTGPDYGIVNASKISATIPEKGETIFANDYKNSDYEILDQGESTKIEAILHIPARYADMQFANMELIWNDCFKVAKAKKLPGKTVEFKIDPGLTEAKN